MNEWERVKAALIKGRPGATPAAREMFAVIRAPIDKELSADECWGPHHTITCEGRLTLNHEALTRATAELAGAGLTETEKQAAAAHLRRHYNQTGIRPMPEILRPTESTSKTLETGADENTAMLFNGPCEPGTYQRQITKEGIICTYARIRDGSGTLVLNSAIFPAGWEADEKRGWIADHTPQRGADGMEREVGILKVAPEKQIVYGEVYVPGDPEHRDAHGQWMNAEEIEKMAHRFMQSMRLQQIDRQHNEICDQGYTVESFIARKGDPDFTEGAWVLAVKVTDNEAWQAIKKGDITGFSLAGMANVIADKPAKKAEGNPESYEPKAACVGDCLAAGERHQAVADPDGLTVLDGDGTRAATVDVRRVRKSGEVITAYRVVDKTGKCYYENSETLAEHLQKGYGLDVDDTTFQHLIATRTVPNKEAEA